MEPVKNDAQATLTWEKELKDNRATTLISFQPELISTRRALFNFNFPYSFSKSSSNTVISASYALKSKATMEWLD